MKDIIEALKTNNSEKVLEYISGNKSVESIKTEHGYGLLHFAIKNGCPAEIISCLLKSDININSASNPEEKTPLELLIDSNGSAYNENKYFDILDSLLDKGAIVDNSIIGAASIEGKPDIIKKLLETIETANSNRNEVLEYIKKPTEVKPFNQLEYPNIRDKEENTLLHYAIENKNIKAFKRLLAQAKIDISLTNKSGNAPLHYAIERKNNNAFDELLTQAEIDINLINKGGDTPLHCAIKNKNVDAFNKLLTQAKIDINLTNKDGQTPLEFAFAKKVGAKFTKPLKRMEKQELKNDLNGVIKKLDITKNLFQKTTQQQPLLFSFSICREMLESNKNDKEAIKMILNFLEENIASRKNDACFYEEKRVENEEVQASKVKLEKILSGIEEERILIKKKIVDLENKKEPVESLKKLQDRVEDIEEIIKPLRRAMEIQNEINQWLQSNDNPQGKELMIFYLTMFNGLKEFYTALSAMRGGAGRSKGWKDNLGTATFATLGILASAALAGVTFGVGAVAAPVLVGGSLMIGEALYGNLREKKKKSDHVRGLDNMREPEIGEKLLGAGYMPDDFYVELSNKLLSISAAKLMQEQIKCCTQDGARKLADAFVKGIKYSIIKEAGSPDNEGSLLLFKKDSKGTKEVPLPTKLDSFKLVRGSNNREFSRHKGHYWQTKHAVHHPGVRCKIENGMKYYSCGKSDAEKYGYRTLPSEEALNNYMILLLRSKFKFCIRTAKDENDKEYILNNIKKAAVEWLYVYLNSSKEWEFYKINKNNSNKKDLNDLFKNKPKNYFDNDYLNNFEVISYFINSYGTDKEKEKLKSMKWDTDEKPIGPPIYNDYELINRKSDSLSSTSSVEALGENSRDIKIEYTEKRELAEETTCRIKVENIAEKNQKNIEKLEKELKQEREQREKDTNEIKKCTKARHKLDKKLNIFLSTKNEVKLVGEQSSMNKVNIESLERELAEETTCRTKVKNIAEKNQKNVEKLEKELKQEREKREKDTNEIKKCTKARHELDKKLNIALSIKNEVKIAGEQSSTNKVGIETLRRELVEEKARRTEAKSIAEEAQRDIKKLETELQKEREKRKEDMQQLLNVIKELLPGTESAADIIARSSSLFCATGSTPTRDEKKLQNDKRRFFRTTG